MHRLFLALAVGLASFAPAGCKIVKTAPVADAAADPDDALVAGIVEQTFAAKLVPLIAAKAQAADVLLPAIAADIANAGGTRGAGDGASWTFAVKGSGKVVAEDRKSRAAKAEVDVTGDGKADLVLQLGPVVKGTALRDQAPFYVFTDFRDQIQFAKLGRALNSAAVGSLTLPDALLGQTVAFEGAFAIQKASDPVLITPVALTVQP